MTFRNPAVAAVALFVVALGFAWRRFLSGQRSPFEEDIEFYHHPMTLELMSAWSDGRIPLWTDRVYCGFPFFVDSQTAAWYPGTLLVAALGPHQGYVWFLLLHALLAALGMLILVRAHGGGWTGGWAAGLGVPLSGFYAFEMEHPGLFAILCWIPLWLVATRAVFLRPTPARLAAASLPLAMMIFAGTLQVLFGAALLFGFYTLGLAADMLAAEGRRRAACGTAAVVGAQLLGMALAAVVLLPTFAHFPHTARALGMTYEFGSMGSVHPLELFGAFANGAEARLGGGDPLGFGGASFYVGALTLLLALVGLATARRRLPIALGAALVAIVWLALGRHGNLYPLLYEWLPGVVGSLRGVGRALGPAVICVALLAGLGLHHVAEPRPRQILTLLLASTLVCVGLAFAFDAAPVAGKDVAPVGGNGLGSAGVLAAALGLCLAGTRRPKIPRPGLAALIAVDLLAFGPHADVVERSAAPPGARQLAGQLRFPALAHIAQGRFGKGDGRVAVLGFGTSNFTFHHGLDGFGGYNPLVTLQYLDFVHQVDQGSPRPRTPLRGFVHNAVPGRIGSPLFQTAATRFVISPVPLEAEGLRLLERYMHPITRGSVLLYENARALPRAYLAYRTLRADRPEELSRLLANGFDGRQATVFEGDAAALSGPAEIQDIAPIRLRPELLRFDVAPEHPALLVVADSWYPGWRAFVDGRETPVLRVNGNFRGVSVPATARRVELRFDPWTFRAGAAISATAGLAIAGLALVSRFRPTARIC